MKQLTNRQIQMLKLISTGNTNKDIAALLNISPYTVANHVRELIIKLDAKSRSNAVMVGIKIGLIKITS